MASSDAIVLPSWAASFAATFERVAHHLELSEGFMLLPVELPDSITANLLVEWLKGRGLACHYVDINYAAQPRPLLERLLEGPAEATATLLFVDKHTEWLRGALQLLNQQRDVLAHRHQRPLLWCGPARFLDLTWRSAPDLWSIAAVPIRLPAPTTRSFELPAERSRPHRHAALVNLLMSLYSADQLRRFIGYAFPEVFGELPWSASLASLTHAVVTTLERHGLIDWHLFLRLRAERPRRYREIDGVAREWFGTAPPGPTSIDDGAASTVIRGVLDFPGSVLFVIAADVQRLHRAVQDAMTALRSTQRVESRPLLALHGEESTWDDRPRVIAANRSAENDLIPGITVVVDLEGRPLGEPDPGQLAEIRRLITEARNAQAHAHPFQLVIPLAGPRETFEVTLLNLSEALSRARLPFHVVDLDASQGPGSPAQ